MFVPSFTVTALDQSRALVQAIKALGAIETSDSLEREVAQLLQGAFERRLEEVVDTVSTWEIGEIMSIGIDTNAH